MIGVFDSGFGGLTILKEFLRKLPEYDYIYLGDNARAPYGNKSEEVIYNYTCEAVDFLFKQGCELVIIACNTASAKALRRIQQEYLPDLPSPLLSKEGNNKRVLGVIIPVVEEAADIKNIKRAGLIGTRATVESGTYEAELKKLNPDIEIHKQACPLLVPLVEEGWIKRPETKKILKKYLRPLKDKNVDALILGCTHYPVLIKEIGQIMGKRVHVFNSPVIVAEKLANYLKRHPEIDKKLEKNPPAGGKRIFYTTDNEERFKETGKKFLGQNIDDINRVEL
jgi:glutamate racemase